jgi:hypothetical protein
MSESNTTNSTSGFLRQLPSTTKYATFRDCVSGVGSKPDEIFATIDQLRKYIDGRGYKDQATAKVMETVHNADMNVPVHSEGSINCQRDLETGELIPMCCFFIIVKFDTDTVICTKEMQSLLHRDCP